MSPQSQFQLLVFNSAENKTIGNLNQSDQEVSIVLLNFTFFSMHLLVKNLYINMYVQ